jgi:YggT family protein
MGFVINLIIVISQVLTWLIIIQALLSFVMSPFHPIRQNIDRFVEPLYRPIRQVLPATGGLDFSPLILIILISVVRSVLIQLLAAFS